MLEDELGLELRALDNREVEGLEETVGRRPVGEIGFDIEQVEAAGIPFDCASERVVVGRTCPAPR